MRTIAMIFAAIGVLACSAVLAQDAGQKVKLKIGKATIGKDSLGFFDSGNPHLCIKVNGESVYDSLKLHPGAKGTEYDFKDTVEFVMPPSACVSVRFVDIDVAYDDVILDRSAVRNYDSELFCGTLSDSKGGGSVEISRVMPEPGRYTVHLLGSYVCPGDARRCGAELVAEDTAKRLADVSRGMYESYQRRQDWKEASSMLAKEAAKCALGMDKLDHRVIVKCGGVAVLDTWSLEPPHRPQGLKAEWTLSFKLDWNPGDKVEIIFKDADYNGDDLIFEVSSTSKDSIELLDGTTFGPMTPSGCSFISFSAIKDDPIK